MSLVMTMTGMMQNDHTMVGLANGENGIESYTPRMGIQRDIHADTTGINGVYHIYIHNRHI